MEIHFIFRREDDAYRLAANFGFSQEYMNFMEVQRVKPGRGTLVGRTALAASYLLVVAGSAVLRFGVLRRTATALAVAGSPFWGLGARRQSTNEWPVDTNQTQFCKGGKSSKQEICQHGAVGHNIYDSTGGMASDARPDA